MSWVSRNLLKLVTVIGVTTFGFYLAYKGDTATAAALIGTMAGYILKNANEHLSKRA